MARQLELGVNSNEVLNQLTALINRLLKMYLKSLRRRRVLHTRKLWYNREIDEAIDEYRLKVMAETKKYRKLKKVQASKK